MSNNRKGKAEINITALIKELEKTAREIRAERLRKRFWLERQARRINIAAEKIREIEGRDRG